MRLGEAIKRERMRQKLSQTALAELAGISSAGLNHIENNYRINPMWSSVTALARVLNLSLDKLERISRQ